MAVTFESESAQEAKEHPWASKAVIARIARDHLRLEAAKGKVQQAKGKVKAAFKKGK